MDSDQYITRNLILGFLLNGRVELGALDLDSLLRSFPLSDDNPDLKKLVLLKELELKVKRNAVSETLFEYLAQLAEIELERGIETVSDAMKRAYCAVMVKCSLSLLRSWEDDCVEKVRRIWRGKIGSVDKVNGGLDSEALWEWNDIIEAALVDLSIRRSALEKFEEVDATRAVKAYLMEEEEKMGPSFLELIASKCGEDLKLLGVPNFFPENEQDMKPSLDQIPENGEVKQKGNVYETVGNADQCTAQVIEEAGDGNQVAKEHGEDGLQPICTGKDVANVDQLTEGEVSEVPNADAANESQKKGIHLRHKLVGLRRSTRGHGPRTVRGAKLVSSDEMEEESSHRNDNLPRSSEVKRVKNALKLSSSDLHAIVMDPLPEALQFADSVCGVGVQTNNKGKDAVEENRVESSAPVSNGNDVPQTSCTVNNVPRPSIMDRNNTALTIQWEDDSLSEPDDERSDAKGRHRLSTPRVIKVRHLMKYEPIKKRRATRRWSPIEEDALRTGVEKYGRGNWKTILNAYRDVFEDRTEVDLKDKWRNLTK